MMGNPCPGCGTMIVLRTDHVRSWWVEGVDFPGNPSDAKTHDRERCEEKSGVRLLRKAAHMVLRHFDINELNVISRSNCATKLQEAIDYFETNKNMRIKNEDAKSKKFERMSRASKERIRLRTRSSKMQEKA